MRRKVLLSFVIVACSIAPLHAQVGARRPFVRASGQGSVSVRPDQLKVNVGVVTQGNTAQEASDQNAALMSAVMDKLRQLVGPSAEIKTVGYSVTPNYRYPPGGGVPTLTGYTANNTMEVTTSDLTLGGKIIDTATQAGANSIQGIRFGLKDAEPARGQALRMATQQAKAHAEAMAGGLSLRIGNIVSLEESSAVRTVALTDTRLAAAGSGTPTPVESGTIEVQAYVVLEAELGGM